MKHLVVLTGAGISAESGLKTFRDANGLWEGHNVTEVAFPEGFAKNPQLVLDFYNQRRKQLQEVQPNKAHLTLATLEKDYKISIITQNIDDLHERSGSTNILHLHGELLKVRSTGNKNTVHKWTKDVNLGDVCQEGHQLRPHIVWFGEAVPLIEKAIHWVEKADILLIIGTSLQVYPAASLMHYAPSGIPIYYIDPNPAISNTKNITVITESATKGITTFIDLLN